MIDIHKHTITQARMERCVNLDLPFAIMGREHRECLSADIHFNKILVFFVSLMGIYDLAAKRVSVSTKRGAPGLKSEALNMHVL